MLSVAKVDPEAGSLGGRALVVADWKGDPDQILACVVKRPLSRHVLDFTHRAERATQIPVLRVPVLRVPVGQTENAPRRRAWARLGRGPCSLTQPVAAA